MTRKPLLARIILAVVIFSVLSFLVWWNLRPKSEPIPLMPLAREEEGATEAAGPADRPQLKGVEVALVNMNQHLNWKLRVEQVREEGEVCLLFGVKGEYYTADGQKYLVEAAEGEMGRDFSWLRLAPEVVLTGEDIRLVAAEVSWEAAAGEELTGRQLQAAGENVEIQAERFTFNPEARRMTFPGSSQWSFQ